MWDSGCLRTRIVRFCAGLMSTSCSAYQYGRCHSICLLLCRWCKADLTCRWLCRQRSFRRPCLSGCCSSRRSAMRAAVEALRAASRALSRDLWITSRPPGVRVSAQTQPFLLYGMPAVRRKPASTQPMEAYQWARWSIQQRETCLVTWQRHDGVVSQTH